MEIYVACLASYNSGRLHGGWINAEQDADDIREDIQGMLKESPVKDAEEWAVHDYDGIPDLGEYPDLENLVSVVEMLNDYDEFVVKYALDNVDNDAALAREFIEDKYLATAEVELFGSDVDAVMEYYAESGMYEESELPEWAQNHYHAILRDMALSDINGGAIDPAYQGLGVYHLFSK